ncbi:MAG TPA: hypothetical protein VFK80_08235 [Limnochordia bacterium]|nr:hypothetical protein [Limnochordia bacterium]
MSKFANDVAEYVEEMGIGPVFEYIKRDMAENPDFYEDGSTHLFQLDNCTVIVTMPEGKGKQRTLGINVIGGEPVRINARCTMFEDEAGEG